jgi:hypothetical protein
MANYPNADNSPGYNYDAAPGILTPRNARSSGSFTISNIATTTVVDAEAETGDIVILVATNQKAATMIAGGTNVTAGIYVSSVTGAGFVVTHTDHAAAQGSTFYYVIFPRF